MAIKDLDTLFLEMIPYLAIDGLKKTDPMAAGLKKSARMDILKNIFPHLMVCVNAEKNDPELKTYEKVAAELPQEERSFYNWCLRVANHKTISNQIGYFFQGSTRHGNYCRDVFCELIDADLRAVVTDIEDRCRKVLEKSGYNYWNENKKESFFTVLKSAADAMIDTLANAANAVTGASVRNDAANSAELYRNALHQKIESADPARALAQTVVCYATHINFAERKNIRDDFARQEKVLFDVWEIEHLESTWQAKVSEGINAFEREDYERAWNVFTEAEQLFTKDNSVSNKETLAYADMLCYKAHLILNGFGTKDATLEEAKEKIRLACEVGSGSANKLYSARAVYEYVYLRLNKEKTESCATDPKLVAALDKSVAGKCVDAVLLKARLLMTGRYGYRQDPVEGETLLRDDNRFLKASDSQKREREMLLAEYYMNNNTDDRAELHYEAAARLGSYEAIRHLRALHLTTADSPDIRLQAGEGSVCFLNSVPETDAESMNAVLADTLDGETWRVLCGDVCASVRRDPLLLNSGHVVFAMMSGNEKKNLADTLKLMKLLNGIAAEQTESDRLDFIGRVDIYLLDTEESAPLMLDSAMGNLSDGVYFRVHLQDPNRIAAMELIARYPNFCPCIDPRNGNVRTETWEGKDTSQRCKRRMVLVGATDVAFEIVRQTVASTLLPDFPIELTVVGRDVERFRARLIERCPDLCESKKYGISFRYFECEPALLPLSRPVEGSMLELQQLLRRADYFVVAGDNDSENLNVGVRIRTDLLRVDPNPDRRPFIAVRYRDRESTWIASQIAVASKDYTSAAGGTVRYHWTEDYDLRLFGSDTAFEADRLFEDSVERGALMLNRTYYGAVVADEHRATGDFFRRSYSRDSSIASYLGMIYQCFELGVFHREQYLYAGCDNASLGRKHYELLHSCGEGGTGINETVLEKGARIEHMRWMGFCASRGWTRPDERDVITYLKKRNPRHHLEIAKLHPYMVSYDALMDTCTRLNHLIEEHNPLIPPLKDPRISDREFVLTASKLLDPDMNTDI